MPLSMRVLDVQSSAQGTPISLAACRVKGMMASPTTQVTGGAPAALRSARRALKCGRQVSSVEWQSEGTSWVASASDGGRPSGMVAKRKPGTPSSARAPRERRRRRWLNSELTKVTWKPRQWRILPSFSIGVTWPCAGNGTSTACGGGGGLPASAATVSMSTCACATCEPQVADVANSFI
ncbi:hypothetical protein U9M48_032746 [Paspalum notatum var. saurae]|uniref:Uncharacterized protein n=1 Tax=Paspalum notatum var. saurae TaxID=547442 RepID=A0AAQ3X4V4_PASNO